MSYINNMNPRRMIWFNQNAPKNKMDLWLSYNRHYEDMSEGETTDTQETTDNPSQRSCDLILKAWDCGEWIPIVGFNTTAANKIDIVEGNTLYHPAIFTGENPNDLYDAGTLGELLKDTHFVTEEDWSDIYNEYIKTIIEQYPFDLWPAEQNELGGIWADTFASTHIDSTAANKTWMAQCKYKYNAQSNYNLYIHAKDIISAVNTYTADNPSAPGIQPGSDFDLWLATTSKIGGIKSDTHSYVLNAFKPVECKFYPNYTTWSLLLGRLCVNARDVIDTFIDSLDDNYPLLIGGPGIEVDLVLDHSQILWKIVGLSNALDGQYPRCKINSQQNHTLEWVDSIDTWRPVQVNGLSVAGLDGDSSGNTVNLVEGKGISISTQSSLNRITPIKVDIDVNGATDGQVLSYNSTTQDVKWVTQTGSYTEGNGIDIDTNVISSQIKESGYSGSGTTIEITNAGIEVGGVIVNPYTITYLFTSEDYVLTSTINALKDELLNPCYFLINAKSITCQSEYINNTQDTPSSHVFSSGKYLVTTLFGVFKIEKITSMSNV